MSSSYAFLELIEMIKVISIYYPIQIVKIIYSDVNIQYLNAIKLKQRYSKLFNYQIVQGN